MTSGGPGAGVLQDLISESTLSATDERLKTTNTMSVYGGTTG